MGNKHWYCLYTKPRMEWRLTDTLTQKGLEVYFPELPRSARDRRRGIRRPFFPRYIFCQMHVPDDLAWVQWTPGLLHVLRIADQPAIIEDEVIARLRERLDTHSEHLKRFGRYKQGERVKLTQGPFKGLEAVFDTKLSGEGRARVLVEFLQRTTPYQVRTEWLTKAQS